MGEPSSSAHPPAHPLTASRAFREVSLRSEVQRAYAVIAVVVIVLLLVFLPSSKTNFSDNLRAIAAIGIGVLFAVQIAVLVFVRWARRRDRLLPLWFVIGTVIIESLIPSGMILWHIARRSLPPYAALSAPPILAYGLLICLTTLRLRPVLCILSSAVSALGYAGILLYVTYSLGITQPTTGLVYTAYINSALLIFISGLGAAWVTREIRGYLDAAVREADTRSQMDRLEHDLSIARSIQQALLPRDVPTIPGFDIAGWNRSADQTGGDYYDWQPLPNRNWILTLADVSGHGVGPAMLTAACRAYMRATSASQPDLPSLAGRINQLLADDLADGRFVTMVNVLIEPGGGPVHLLSAGHGPIALYIGKTGEVQDILPQDMPLAVVPDLKFGPALSITMAPGDVLALITDGFVEWARADRLSRREQFGMDRLRESLRAHAHLPAARMIEAIAADVAAFAQGEPQQDDLTMVILRRVG